VSFKTLVQFKDGSKETAVHHTGSPAGALTEAVKHAEAKAGQPHDGAWLEIVPDEE
jgi:hypothetical protein